MNTQSDYHLRFPSESESFSVAVSLNAASYTDDGPRLVRFTHRYAIDVIGEIVVPPAIEGGESETLPGWHVNLRVLDGSDLPENLSQYVVNPSYPNRVWA